MPLRDHFHPPLEDLASWDVVHGQWPAMMVLQLNSRLPSRYVAGPLVHLGSEIEVDVVTTRNFNLYAELLELVGQRDVTLGPGSVATYAAACRWLPRGRKSVLESWSFALRIGRSLPTLPIWLAENLAVPLDLEACYEATCRALRIE